jgi:flagellar basal-body rod protein FlgB
MAIGDLPLMDVLKTKMRWNQARQRLLSENTANADTPHFRGKDLKKPNFDPSGLRQPEAPAFGVAVTAAGHIEGRPVGSGSGFRTDGRSGFEVTPNGNSVNLEDEMLKAAETQMDFQAVSSLYQRSLGTIRTALGRRA